MPVSTLNTDILTASLGKAVALAYGRHVVAGNVILQDESDPDRTTVFIALGEGEWEAIEELFVNGAEPFPMASTFKVPVAVELLTRVQAGTVRLDSMITVPLSTNVGTTAFGLSFKYSGRC